MYNNVDESKCGVYCIVNTEEFKLYCGSSKNTDTRLYHHLRLLKNKRHHSWKLQKAYCKYGEQSFSLIVVETCREEDLLTLEKKYIDALDSVECGYNVSYDATSPMYGRNHTKEARKRISDMSKKMWDCPEKKAQIIESLRKAAKTAKRTKYNHTENAKAEISIASKKMWSTKREYLLSRMKAAVDSRTEAQLAEIRKKEKIRGQKLAKKVNQYCKYSGRFIKSWGSIAQAEFELNLDKVGDCCRRAERHNTCGEFIFRFANESQDMVLCRDRRVAQIDPATNSIVKLWIDGSKAAKSLATHRNNIYRWCERDNIFFGYKWKLNSRLNKG